MGKYNFLRIPPDILHKLTLLAVDEVVVAVAKHVPAVDIPDFQHLGLQPQAGELVIPPPVVPPAHIGKYSDRNVYGAIRVRRDLPKIDDSFSWESPNWGGHGTHTCYSYRKVYQKDVIPPKELPIAIELVREQNQIYTLTFRVDQVLSRASPTFEIDLLYNLNLLQENVRAVGVHASAQTLADFAATMHVQWQFLPPGTAAAEIVRQMLEGTKPVSLEQRNVMRTRIEAIQQLAPRHIIFDTGAFRRYFGALFENDFVVFENYHYGNAIYVLKENWEELSQRTRLELLKGPPHLFKRIIHTNAWFQRLKVLLREHREHMPRPA